ncbi:MarR family winged helix-turn-helix transcriptional regulator [Aureivirga marina]|uniref:MarR family winged helix-turn-helix transcriptional regulator n=1 Tax=Aureivirga marina TaxID=1182451 RepID=UPI0018CB7950|nr:MarR family transcriptional regulator [Aureivirga marina]
MENDIFRELKYLAFTARLKRISDNMLYNAKDLYKELELDIDPNWHLIFMMFKEKDTLTMTEIADAFQISQPAVIKIINKMKQKEYLISTKDATDSRKQLLQLSAKAKENLPKLEKVWEAGRKSIMEILEGNETILEQLDEIENQISKMNYKQRVLKNLQDD